MASIAPPCHTRRVETTDDWVTPKHIIDRLWPFDLDPCESDTQPWPCASRGYRVCRGEDGLTLPWSGLVYLNSPYGKATGAWLNRLALHGSGIALVFARTETRMFFEYVWPYAACLLFLRGRLTFHYPSGNASPAGHNSGGPSVLIAYGPVASARLAAAKDLGALVTIQR